MKKFVRFVVWLSLPISTAFSDTLPDIFNKVPKVQLPFSVGRNSYSGLSVSSASAVDRSLGEVPRNEKDYKSIMELHRYLLKDQRNDIFSLNNMQWIDDKFISQKSARWRLSQLPCVKNFECFLFGDDAGGWLIVAKNKSIIDFQRVTASRRKQNERNGYEGQAATLDTMFGEVGLFPYPETDYEKTGIFCSVLITSLSDGNEKVQIFKRRITPEGKIENKAVPEGVHECKLPW